MMMMVIIIVPITVTLVGIVTAVNLESAKAASPDNGNDVSIVAAFL